MFEQGKKGKNSILSKIKYLQKKYNRFFISVKKLKKLIKIAIKKKEKQKNT